MIPKVCRRLGRAVLWAGGTLAALMLAVGTNPDLRHGTTLGQTMAAALFVVVCAAVLGGILLLAGRRNSN